VGDGTLFQIAEKQQDAVAGGDGIKEHDLR